MWAGKLQNQPKGANVYRTNGNHNTQTKPVNDKLAFPFRLCGGPAHCKRLLPFGEYIINRNEATGFRCSLYPVALLRRKCREWEGTPILRHHSGPSPVLGYARHFRWSHTLSGIIGMIYPTAEFCEQLLNRYVESAALLTEVSVSGNYRVNAEVVEYKGEWYKLVKEIEALHSIDIVDFATAGGRLLNLETEAKLS